jgi:vacuolar-type H+-ATPase catalytic subunit A/Vma1
MMLNLVFTFYDEAEKAIANNIPLERITALQVKSQIGQSKRIAGEDPREEFLKIMAAISASFDQLAEEARQAQPAEGGAQA